MITEKRGFLPVYFLYDSNIKYEYQTQAGIFKQSKGARN
jgi:hypothetical protein